MHAPSQDDPDSAAAEDDTGLAVETELSLLRDIFGMRPPGVTVQDERARFLLVTDAAALQLGIAAGDADGIAAGDPVLSQELHRRRETGLELLRTGRPAVAEETVSNGPVKQVLLTAHRPVRIADRNLLLSSSADISEQKAVEDHLFRSAYYDELTGLPMRRVVEHRANSLLQRDEPHGRFALAFLDIDNFKHINDYYGHAIGDELLVEVARRLGLNLRESDMLSRISGDEFLLLLNPIQSEHEVAEYIHFTLDRLKAPFFIDGSEIFASTSIGVSVYPDHGRSYEALRQNADIAMYRVKNNGKGSAAFFDAGMGGEALGRLRDDEGVIQAPGTFINLAVELGLIDELTHLVLAEIVKSIDLINDTFGHDTTISINVAAKQAGNPEFMRSFADALEATGFPKRFMTEVTEDAFVTKSHFQDEILPIFRKLGVGISIDDFGIGYSSLSALADITADEIKIDRSFITDIHKRPRSQGILRAIEWLSEALGMTVGAGGIEAFEELADLQAATKIRYAQVYYFSRPIFLEELRPPVRILDHARASAASRPHQESRSVYARNERYRG